LDDNKLNNSTLNEDKVVKLPNNPIYKKIYILPWNLFRNSPAKKEPKIFTIMVLMDNPNNDKFNSPIKYLREDPAIAPIRSAM